MFCFFQFEISINEVLQGAHLSDGRWLDLPHSVFIKIALGLEKEGITVGDWRALAERLGKIDIKIPKAIYNSTGNSTNAEIINTNVILITKIGLLRSS